MFLECFGSNQYWSTNATACVRTCENPDPSHCDAALRVPRCRCPDDKPFLINDIHCVTREQCPSTYGRLIPVTS